MTAEPGEHPGPEAEHHEAKSRARRSVLVVVLALLAYPGESDDADECPLRAGGRR